MTAPERAAPDLERPPSHPGADGRVVNCRGRGGRCGQALGVIWAGHFYVRHKEREIICPLPVWVKCERCDARRRIGLTECESSPHNT